MSLLTHQPTQPLYDGICVFRQTQLARIFRASEPFAECALLIIVER